MPNQPAQARGKWSRWFRPSLGDCLVIAVLLWPIVMTVIGADAGLLLDSATGCHIRTGDYIIEHASVPHVDPFSFTKNGQVWFAWEWLADLLFARIFGIWGMQGLVVICALLIAATAYVWFATRCGRRRCIHDAGSVPVLGRRIIDSFPRTTTPVHTPVPYPLVLAH